MHLAARSVQEPQRSTLTSKAKEYDTQIKTIKKDLKKAEASSEREDLMSGFSVTFFNL